MRLNAEKNLITLYSDSGLKRGVPCKADWKGQETRPDGFFAYVSIIWLKLTIPLTKNGTGADATAQEMWEAAGEHVSMKIGNSTRFNGYKFLSLIRRVQQFFELLGPDQVGLFLPSGLTTSSEDTSYTVKLPIPLAPFLRCFKNPTGVVSLATLAKRGSFSFTLGSPDSAIIAGDETNNWAINDDTGITCEIQAQLMETEQMLETIIIEERDFELAKTSPFELHGPKDKRRRPLALGAIGANGGAITQSDSITVIKDGAIRMSGVSGDDLVMMANEARVDGINDVCPACTPLVAPGQFQDITDLPVVDSKMKVRGLADGEAGDIRVLEMVAWRPSPEDQRLFMAEQIDDGPEDEQAREMTAMKGYMAEMYKGEGALDGAVAYFNDTPVIAARKRFKNHDFVGNGNVEVRV